MEKMVGSDAEAFARELSELDAFVEERRRSGDLQVGAEDPDVRRLVEVLAFCSVRARAAAAHASEAALTRMAGEGLRELMALAPAAVLLEVVFAETKHESVRLPRGTMIRAEQWLGAGEPRVCFFSTLRDFWLAPVRMARLQTLVGAGGTHVDITLHAHGPVPSGFEVTFQVHRSGDARAAATVMAAMRRCLVEVRVVRGADATPVEIPAEVSFGSADDPRSPLEKVRGSLHFPEQSHCFTVRFPKGFGGRELTVRLLLSDAWPHELVLDASGVRPFVVPAENVWSDLAVPITHDGTRDMVPLAIGTRREGAELVGVNGVYDAGRELRPLVPLAPLALGRSSEGFEVIRPPGGGDAMLRLRLADAPRSPRRIVVDARWSQPSLWESPPDRVTWALHRYTTATKVSVLGRVRRPAPSPIAADPAQLLDVMALRDRRSLSRDELVALIHAAGVTEESPFYALLPALDWSSVDDVPDHSTTAGGIVRRYRIGWRTVRRDADAMIAALCAIVEGLLDALGSVPVRVEPEFSSKEGST